MRKYMKEVTDTWVCDYRVPSHTYIMERNKCVGYIKEGTTDEIIFKAPLKQFDTRRRKFEEVKCI